MTTDEVPSGCLACNHDVIAAALQSRGVDPTRFVQCPPTRHAWSDVLPPCQECGAWFLVEPKSDTRGPVE